MFYRATTLSVFFTFATISLATYSIFNAKEPSHPSSVTTIHTGDTVIQQNRHISKQLWRYQHNDSPLYHECTADQSTLYLKKPSEKNQFFEELENMTYLSPQISTGPSMGNAQVIQAPKGTVCYHAKQFYAETATIQWYDIPLSQIEMPPIDMPQLAKTVTKNLILTLTSSGPQVRADSVAGVL